MREFTHRFRAMNTDVQVAVVAEADNRPAVERSMRQVEDLFVEIEAALSRFRPESELSRLNRAAGRPSPASPLLFAVVSEAVAAARATDGLFDPTVLPALLAAGYDRSFELLDHGPSRHLHPAPGAAASWRDVRLHPAALTIHLPPGCRLDLGGIGKGWAVDRAVDLLRVFPGFAVDAGGDLYAGGVQADDAPWTIGVEDPSDPGRDLLVLAVRDRAVATSTTARRRWRSGGAERHHLIDPRTGLPSESGVAAATVVADSTTRAEVLAKAALLLGPQAGLELLNDRPESEGLLVLADGLVAFSNGFLEAQHVSHARHCHSANATSAAGVSGAGRRTGH